MRESIQWLGVPGLDQIYSNLRSLLLERLDVPSDLWQVDLSVLSEQELRGSFFSVPDLDSTKSPVGGVGFSFLRRHSLLELQHLQYEDASFFSRFTTMCEPLVGFRMYRLNPLPWLFSICNFVRPRVTHVTADVDAPDLNSRIRVDVRHNDSADLQLSQIMTGRLARVTMLAAEWIENGDAVKIRLFDNAKMIIDVGLGKGIEERARRAVGTSSRALDG